MTLYVVSDCEEGFREIIALVAVVDHSVVFVVFEDFRVGVVQSGHDHNLEVVINKLNGRGNDVPMPWLRMTVFQPDH